MNKTDFINIQEGILKVTDDHAGAVIDHVFVVIDDCVYDLIKGTETFTPIEDWDPKLTVTTQCACGAGCTDGVCTAQELGDDPTA